MSAKKKPGLIVMKRLDTMGLRLLSQAVGAGSRRAGVRLSPHGALTPHQRGEPITQALAPMPARAGGFAGADESDAQREAPPMLEPLETPAIIDATGKVAAEIRERATTALVSQIEASRRAEAVSAAGHAPFRARACLEVPSPARTGMTMWAIGFIGAGVLAGVLIARLVGGDPGVGTAPALALRRGSVPMMAEAPLAPAPTAKVAPPLATAARAPASAAEPSLREPPSGPALESPAP